MGLVWGGGDDCHTPEDLYALLDSPDFGFRFRV